MKRQLPNGDTVEEGDGFRRESFEWNLPSVLPIPITGEGGATLVNCVQAEGRVVNACFPPDRSPFAVLALLARGPSGVTGLYTPYDAATLRDHAATFLRIADTLDGGKGKQ